VGFVQLLVRNRLEIRRTKSKTGLDWIRGGGLVGMTHVAKMPDQDRPSSVPNQICVKKILALGRIIVLK